MKTQQIRIWIPAYRPFLMGGRVRGPVCTTVEGTPVDLGRGFKGYSVRTPAGGIVIADAKSGGIVGQSLAQVRADIKRADLSVMRKQVRDETARGKDADPLHPDEFWKHVMGATKRVVAHASA